MGQTRMLDNPIVERDTSFLKDIRPSHTVPTASSGLVNKGRLDADGVGGGFPCRVVFGDSSEEEDDGETPVQLEMLEFDVGGPVPCTTVDSLVGHDGSGNFVGRSGSWGVSGDSCEADKSVEGVLGKIGWSLDWSLDSLVVDNDLSGCCGLFVVKGSKGILDSSSNGASAIYTEEK